MFMLQMKSIILNYTKSIQIVIDVKFFKYSYTLSIHIVTNLKYFKNRQNINKPSFNEYMPTHLILKKKNHMKPHEAVCYKKKMLGFHKQFFKVR